MSRLGARRRDHVFSSYFSDCTSSVPFLISSPHVFAIPPLDTNGWGRKERSQDNGRGRQKTFSLWCHGHCFIPVHCYRAGLVIKREREREVMMGRKGKKCQGWFFLSSPALTAFCDEKIIITQMDEIVDYSKYLTAYNLWMEKEYSLKTPGSLPVASLATAFYRLVLFHMKYSVNCIFLLYHFGFYHIEVILNPVFMSSRKLSRFRR